ADKNNISLSRLTEFFYRKITTGHYTSLEDLPVADWVNLIAEGKAEYKTKKSSRKNLKDEFYSSKALSMVAEDQVKYPLKSKSRKNPKSKSHSSKKK
ncbi:MAG: hypothetical protein ACHQK8_04470, partial [Bacteroidia bacterium]